MKPTLQIRKAIAVGIGLAALAVPAGATAYPLIPDEPGANAAAVGHDWMAKHTRKAVRRPKPSTKPGSICNSHGDKVACPKP